MRSIVYHQNVVLHIIKALVLYIIIAKASIQPAADDMYTLCDDIRTPCGDDMPSLRNG